MISDSRVGFSQVFLGLVILVLIGVGVAYFIDGGSGENGNKYSIASLTKPGKENHKLEAEAAELDKRWVALRRDQGEVAYLKQNVNELKEQIQSANSEVEVLQELVRNEKDSIRLLEEGMVELRLRYRDHVREAAVGEKHARIETQQGKELLDVEILEIAPEGISVRHAGGHARLGFEKMPQDWINRFMYHAVEAKKAEAEARKQQGNTRVMLARRDKLVAAARRPLIVKQKIADLRRQINALGIKRANASLRAGLAQKKESSFGNLQKSKIGAKSSYRLFDANTKSYSTSGYQPSYRNQGSKSKYVPGSLETWDQLQARYRRLEAKYSAQITSLKSKLDALVAEADAKK